MLKIGFFAANDMDAYCQKLRIPVLLQPAYCDFSLRANNIIVAIKRVLGKNSLPVNNILDAIVDLYNHKNFLLKSIIFVINKNMNFDETQNLPVTILI